MDIQSLTEKPWLNTLIVLLAFQVVAFCLFAPSFQNEWTYDDFPVIVDNPDVRSWAGFLEDSYPDRPLRELTFLVDYTLFGLKPAGWHIQQIFWHGLGAALLAFFARRLTLSWALSAGAGLLFLCHPLVVEVVGNLSHRKDSLALACILLGLLAHCRACDASGRRRLGWVAVALLVFYVGTLAKQNALVLPLYWVVYELTLLPREKRFWTRYRFVAPAAGVAGVAYALYWYFPNGGRHDYLRLAEFLFSKMNAFGPVTEADYLPMLLKSWGFMFARVFWPVDLGVEYFIPVPQSWADPLVLATVAALLLFFIAVAWTGHRERMACLCLLFVAIAWLPVSNLWPSAYFAADRYLYVPVAWTALLLVVVLNRLFEDRQRLALGLIVAVCVPLAVLTWQQNKVWRTEWALWHHAYEISPESVYVLNNLGVLYGEKRQMRQAFEFVSRAAENPYCQNCQTNMARLYEWMGQPEKAREYYRRAMNPH